MLLKWEAKDEDVIDLWKKLNGWVYEGFDSTYESHSDAGAEDDSAAVTAATTAANTARTDYLAAHSITY